MAELQVYFMILIQNTIILHFLFVCYRFLYLYDVEKKTWLTLMNDADYRSYTVMSIAPLQQSCVVLGNIFGKLRIFLADGKLHYIPVYNIFVH